MRIGRDFLILGINEVSHEHDAHIPPRHPKSEEDFNALTQNNTR